MNDSTNLPKPSGHQFYVIRVIEEYILEDTQEAPEMLSFNCYGSLNPTDAPIAL